MKPTTKPPRSKLKSAWELIALVAVVDALIVGELIFQWAGPRALAADTVHDGYWIYLPLVIRDRLRKQHPLGSAWRRPRQRS